LASGFDIFGKLANLGRLRAYMRAAPPAHRSFLVLSGALPSLNGALRSLNGALRSLNGSFCFIGGFLGFWKQNLPNCWRWDLFSLPILFWELANNEIWETKFAKLLEMLVLFDQLARDRLCSQWPASLYWLFSPLLLWNCLNNSWHVPLLSYLSVSLSCQLHV
jgi:hypothetical protein